MKLFLAPHNDDEILWGSFTILRERPAVCVIFDSHIQATRGLPITPQMRRHETGDALRHLVGPGYVDFIGIPDNSRELTMEVTEALSKYKQHGVDHVWAPAYEEGGHWQHNVVGTVAASLWPDRITRYLTYTTAGKSRSTNEVPYEPEWIIAKHRALCEYRSQILNPGTRCLPHFVDDIREYYADAQQ